MSNERILAQVQGVPAQKGTWETDHDPRNPNRIEANDNADDLVSEALDKAVEAIRLSDQ